MVGDPATLGILTVSDRAHKGEYEDEGGPAILQFFKEAIHLNGVIITELFLMKAAISEAIIEMTYV